MFISRSTLDDLKRRANNAEYDFTRLNDRYWALWHELELVKAHFGIYIEQVEKHMVLREKGGPEKG